MNRFVFGALALVVVFGCDGLPFLKSRCQRAAEESCGLTRDRNSAQRLGGCDLEHLEEEAGRYRVERTERCRRDARALVAEYQACVARETLSCEARPPPGGDR